MASARHRLRHVTVACLKEAAKIPARYPALAMVADDIYASGKTSRADRDGDRSATDAYIEVLTPMTAKDPNVGAQQKAGLHEPCVLQIVLLVRSHSHAATDDKLDALDTDVRQALSDSSLTLALSSGQTGTWASLCQHGGNWTFEGIDTEIDGSGDYVYGSLLAVFMVVLPACFPDTNPDLIPAEGATLRIEGWQDSQSSDPLDHAEHPVFQTLSDPS